MRPLKTSDMMSESADIVAFVLSCTNRIYMKTATYLMLQL